MLSRPQVATVLLALATIISSSASVVAADGYARRSGTLRAGPGSDYPAIDQISAGDSIDIHGCLRHRNWCDISVADERGWFPGSRIAVLRDGRRVIITEEPDVDFGLPIVSFGMGAYWGAYYADRPFYREHRYWRRYGVRPPPNVFSGPDRQPNPKQPNTSTTSPAPRWLSRTPPSVQHTPAPQVHAPRSYQNVAPHPMPQHLQGLHPHPSAAPHVNAPRPAPHANAPRPLQPAPKSPVPACPDPARCR